MSPAINGKAVDMAYELALDVLTMKVGESKTFNFIDEPITLRREK